MRSKGFEGMACSMAEVMGALGDRWGMLVMRDLLLGLTRYDDLQRSTGITNATLSDRLRSLQEAGLIERRQYQHRPDRYDYIPTAKGRDLALLLQAMVQIGDAWRAREAAAEPLHFLDTETGARLKLAVVDAATGAPLARPKLRIAAGPAADEAMQWRLAHGEAERAARSQATYAQNL